MSDNLLLYLSSIICALLTIYQIFNRQKRASILSAIVLLGYSLPLYYVFIIYYLSQKNMSENLLF